MTRPIERRLLRPAVPQILSFLFLLVLGTFPVAACDNPTYVEYRGNVCLDGFTYGDTSRSSWIHGAWYDENNAYMVISLEGSNYHYCRFPLSVWNGLLEAVSPGRFNPS